ncbi:MAG: prevent-host-death family protein [Geminicoccaceae bacterium]|jgi:prevent-host-death family protein|nr:prevent-host-death family protein [Geminicoccaceae bacterium]
MTTLNLYAAKVQLSKLVDRAAAGEEIVIAKAGKPMARLVPLERAKKLREPGFLKGKIWIADDFDEWPEDILASFDTEIEPPEDTPPEDTADDRR